MNTSQSVRDVGLFVTCTADLFRPSVGFAAIKLLEDAGCNVTVPPSQTCCGQPAYNAGDNKDAKSIAKAVIAAFEGFAFVVAPSGSCAGMLRHHYTALLEDEKDWSERAKALGAKTFELVSFLTDVCDVTSVRAKLDATVTYHDSCSSNREMNVKSQPRKLLETVEGLTLKELDDTESCCGFGGLFSVKYDDISAKIASRKTADIKKSQASLLVGADLGCLLNIAGKLSREGAAVDVRHVAEVLAGMTDHPSVGGRRTR
jgi:L-lactate dehydrogenase complex protein LldE